MEAQGGLHPADLGTGQKRVGAIATLLRLDDTLPFLLQGASAVTHHSDTGPRSVPSLNLAILQPLPSPSSSNCQEGKQPSAKATSLPAVPVSLWGCLPTPTPWMPGLGSFLIATRVPTMLCVASSCKHPLILWCLPECPNSRVNIWLPVQVSRLPPLQMPRQSCCQQRAAQGMPTPLPRV